MATVIGSAAISAATAALAARSNQTTVIVIQNQPAVPVEASEGGHAGAIWLAMGIIVFLLVAIFKD